MTDSVIGPRLIENVTPWWNPQDRVIGNPHSHILALCSLSPACARPWDAHSRHNVSCHHPADGVGGSPRALFGLIHFEGTAIDIAPVERVDCR